MNDTLASSQTGGAEVVDSARAREVLLIVMAGADVGKIFTLAQDKPLYLIGRDDNADIQILDGEISRRHAAVRFDARSNHYVVADLNSRNGTFLNGDKLSAEQPLKPTDKIRLGTQTVLRLSLGSETEAGYARKMYHVAQRDALTGAFNRRYLDERLESELAFAKRHDEPLSLLLLDLDHFKVVNDRYGHRAGDSVLSRFSKLVHEQVRTEDVVARYGGEEFAVVCRLTDEQNAIYLAERLRKTVENECFEHEGESIRITVSIGFAATSKGNVETVADLLEAADKALYVAKERGRNRWVAASLAPPSSGPPSDDEDLENTPVP